MWDIFAIPEDWGFGSAFYVGGQGFGPEFRSLVFQDDDDDTGPASGYKLDGYGDILMVGESPLANGVTYLPCWNICRGLVESLFEWGRGYVLDGFGGIHPWGGAAPVSNGPSWDWDISRGIVLIRGGPTGADQSGYVLDGWGGIHPWSAEGIPLPPAPTNVTGYWPGFDIARAIVLTADGTGGYVLDGYGAIHQWGSAPAPAPVNVTTWWPGFDIARDVVLLPPRVLSAGSPDSGYVLDGSGGIHPWGTPPSVTPSFYAPFEDICTSIALTPDGSQGAVLTKSGDVYPFSIG
jgi:hypothetical protein